jgi:hypothetical protein
MATQPGKTVKVTLVYGYAVTTPQFHHVKKGDKITFTSPQGSLDLLLTPKELFNTNRFKTGDDPILVTKSGPVQIWCGGSFQVPQTAWVGPEVTIKPTRGKYGVHSETATKKP